MAGARKAKIRGEPKGGSPLELKIPAATSRLPDGVRFAGPKADWGPLREAIRGLELGKFLPLPVPEGMEMKQFRLRVYAEARKALEGTGRKITTAPQKPEMKVIWVKAQKKDQQEKG